MEYKIIYAKDMKKNEVKDWFQTIKDNRPSLFHQIATNVKKENSVGIREDVLRFLADHVNMISGDDTFLYHVGQFAGNVKLDPRWYEWLLEYYAGEARIAIKDFYMLVNAAAEKDMELEDLKACFSRNDEDQLRIMNEIYGEEIKREEEEEITDSEDQDDEEEKDAVEISEENGGELANYEQTAVVEESKGEDGYVGLFDDILTAVSLSRKPDASVNEMRDQFSSKFNALQGIITDISGSTAEVFRVWEKNREEIERLRSLYSMLQHVLEKQTCTINEQRLEIMQLTDQLEEAKKTAIRREAIDRKIFELENLAKSSAQEFSFDVTEK